SSSLPLSGSARRVVPSSTPNLNQQRSITINLNSMSWEENSCSSSPDPDSQLCSYEVLHNNDNNNASPSPPPSINAFFSNDSFNNDNELCKQESTTYHDQKSTQ